jgi:hypothetical protein
MWFPATLVKIGKYALACTSLAEADFRECPKLAEVGFHAFYSCSALREVHFGSAIHSGPAISGAAGTFDSCGELELVTMPVGAPVPTGLPARVRVVLGSAYHQL